MLLIRSQTGDSETTQELITEGDFSIARGERAGEDLVLLEPKSQSSSMGTRFTEDASWQELGHRGMHPMLETEST